MKSVEKRTTNSFHLLSHNKSQLFSQMVQHFIYGLTVSAPLKMQIYCLYIVCPAHTIPSSVELTKLWDHFYTVLAIQLKLIYMQTVLYCKSCTNCSWVLIEYSCSWPIFECHLMRPVCNRQFCQFSENLPQRNSVCLWETTTTTTTRVVFYLLSSWIKLCS